MYAARSLAPLQTSTQSECVFTLGCARTTHHLHPALLPCDAVNPSGAYRRYFTLDKSWTKPTRDVYLHFGACGTSAMTLWLNGAEAGYCEDAKSPAEFKV